MHSDPIADMACRMRNAQLANHSTVRVPYSRIKESVLSVLKSKTYIHDFKMVKDGKFEELEVSFNMKRDNLNIKRISKPGQRIYVKGSDIEQVRNGRGISVVSTSEGVLAGFEAYKKKIGGEIMLEVY